jgi:hypothetical protein
VESWFNQATEAAHENAQRHRITFCHGMTS